MNYIKPMYILIAIIISISFMPAPADAGESFPGIVRVRTVYVEKSGENAGKRQTITGRGYVVAAFGKRYCVTASHVSLGVDEANSSIGEVTIDYFNEAEQRTIDLAIGSRVTSSQFDLDVLRLNDSQTPYFARFVPSTQNQTQNAGELLVHESVKKEFMQNISNLNHPSFFRSGVLTWIPALDHPLIPSPINSQTLSNIESIINQSRSALAHQRLYIGAEEVHNEVILPITIEPGMSGSPLVHLQQDGKLKVLCTIKATSKVFSESWCSTVGWTEKLIDFLNQIELDSPPNDRTMTNLVDGSWHIRNGLTYREASLPSFGVNLSEINTQTRIDVGGGTRSDGGGGTRSDGGGGRLNKDDPKALDLHEIYDIKPGFLAGKLDQIYDKHVLGVSIKTKFPRKTIFLPATSSVFENLLQFDFLKAIEPESDNVDSLSFLTNDDNPLPHILNQLHQSNLIWQSRDVATINLRLEQVIPLSDYHQGQAEVKIEILRANQKINSILVSIILPEDKIDFGLNSDWTLQGTKNSEFRYRIPIVSQNGENYLIDTLGLLFINPGHGFLMGAANNDNLNTGRISFKISRGNKEYLLFDRFQYKASEKNEQTIKNSGIDLHSQIRRLRDL